jgi:Zn-dependent protease
MSGWWMYDLWQTNPLGLFCAVFWVVFSICLHELGHGFVAIRCGDDTPRHTGHMTWNPFVHIPPMAWILFAIVGITWGLMPVNPSRFRRWIDEAWVSFAGPAVNLILVALCIVLDAAWLNVAGRAVSDQTFQNIHVFFHLGARLNVVLFVFNLLPVPPLDGSNILGTFIPEFRRLARNPNAMVAGLVILMIASRMGGGSMLFTCAERVSSGGVSSLVRLFHAIAR